MLWGGEMLTVRKKELHDKAQRERRRCYRWLMNYVRPGQPKPATKVELREAAISELGISQNVPLRWGPPCLKAR